MAPTQASKSTVIWSQKKVYEVFTIELIIAGAMCGIFLFLWLYMNFFHRLKPAYQRMKYVSFWICHYHELSCNMFNLIAGSRWVIPPPPSKSLKDQVSSPVKTISSIVKRIISPVKLFTSNLRNPSSEDPAEMNILLEPFFTNKWIAKKGGEKGEGKLTNN